MGMGAGIAVIIAAVLLVALLIVIALVVMVVITYNGLVKARNSVKNSFAQIDAQLQRRFDLLPNLVETVKRFATHEKRILENVTAARSGYLSAHDAKDKIAMNKQLSATLKSLFVETLLAFSNSSAISQSTSATIVLRAILYSLSVEKLNLLLKYSFISSLLFFTLYKIKCFCKHLIR